MSELEIYYFSGTGNSLHIAKELQKRILGTNLIPIVSLLNKDVIETSGETIGLVFPIHGMTVPIPVKKFVKKLDLKSSEYTFGIATRAGTQHRVFIE
jgi:flavodoxin